MVINPENRKMYPLSELSSSEIVHENDGISIGEGGEKLYLSDEEVDKFLNSKGKGEISFQYHIPGNQPPIEELSMRIGKKTELFKNIQSLKSSGGNRVLVAKTFLVNYIAAMIPSAEVGKEIYVEAQFSGKACTRVLVGEDASRRKEVKGQNSVVKNLTNLEKKIGGIVEKVSSFSIGKISAQNKDKVKKKSLKLVNKIKHKISDERTSKSDRKRRHHKSDRKKSSSIEKEELKDGRVRFVYQKQLKIPADVDPNDLNEINKREYTVETEDTRVIEKLEREEVFSQSQQNEEIKNDGAFLKSPVNQANFTTFQDETKYLKGKDGSVLFGVAGAKGTARDTYEDAHLAEIFEVRLGGKRKEVQITAIFDGHGGAEASSYAKANIVKHLKKHLKRQNPKKMTDLGIWNALKLAMVDLSRSFTENNETGTTANVCLRIDDALWVANLGDSRAVLVDSNGKTTQLSEDEKASDKRYEKSVKDRGGYVLQARVDEVLAVPRALGDHSLKGHVSARPKITKFDLKEFENPTLVQCCDGIFDVASSNAVGEVVHKERQSSPEDIATSLLNRAFNARSQDDLSVMVTPLSRKNQSELESELGKDESYRKLSYQASLLKERAHSLREVDNPLVLDSMVLEVKKEIQVLKNEFAEFCAENPSFNGKEKNLYGKLDAIASSLDKSVLDLKNRVREKEEILERERESLVYEIASCDSLCDEIQLEMDVLEFEVKRESKGEIIQLEKKIQVLKGKVNRLSKKMRSHSNEQTAIFLEKFKKERFLEWENRVGILEKIYRDTFEEPPIADPKLLRKNHGELKRGFSRDHLDKLIRGAFSDSAELNERVFFTIEGFGSFRVNAASGKISREVAPEWVEISKNQIWGMSKLLETIGRFNTDIQDGRTNLFVNHDQVMNEVYSSYKNRELAANILGDERFNGRKSLDNMGLDGAGTENAIQRFYESLITFADQLELKGKMTKEIRGKIDVMLEEYHMFYVSSLARRQIKSTPMLNDQIVGRFSDTLMKDIRRVVSGDKKRGAWLVGSVDHFVPMRYENIENSRNIRVCFFNLGGGSNYFQKSFGHKLENESRIGELYFRRGDESISYKSLREKFPGREDLVEREVQELKKNGYRDSVECSPEYLEGELGKKFFEQLISIGAIGELNKYLNLIGGHIPNKEKALIGQDERPPDVFHLENNPIPPQNFSLNTSFVQKPQKMGDCTCKGQWAMLKKGFDRLGLEKEFYREFKQCTQRFAIDRFSEVSEQIENEKRTNYVTFDLEENYPLQLSDEKIRAICESKHLKMSGKEIQNAKRGGQSVVTIPFAKYEKKPISLTVERLFQGCKKVVFGGGNLIKGEGEMCYAINGGGLNGRELELSREGQKLSVKSIGGGVPPCSIKKKGNMRLDLGKNEEVELREGDVLCSPDGNEIFVCGARN